MRHHASAAVIGLLTAAILAAVSPSHAASADPTGYWMKPDAERESKIHVFKCGKSKTHLCAKISWLKQPNDSKGRPLHDIRNQDPSQRDRPIVGLHIFSGLVPSAPSTWTGKIYNPEDGNTYSATLTVVSRKQIVLRGCKAWLLCGEKQWLRTTPPEVEAPVPAEGTEQIEASVTPQIAPDAPAADAAASAEPVMAPSGEATPALAPIAAPAPQERIEAVAVPETQAEPYAAGSTMPEPSAPLAQQIAAPAETPAAIDAGRGYGFLEVSTGPDMTDELSGENVSSMILMTAPIKGAAAAQPVAKTNATPSVQPARLAPTKPKAQPKPVATAAKPVATAPKPVANAAKPVATAPKPAPKPALSAEPAEPATPMPQDADAVPLDAEDPDAIPAETAEATLVDPVPLTRRERRMLRRQQREGADLPWLR
jgi:uncharacterized protein (DUF2147 family)